MRPISLDDLFRFRLVGDTQMARDACACDDVLIGVGWPTP